MQRPKPRPAARASLVLVGDRKEDDDDRGRPPTMRSVSGTVASSKTISLSKAAAVLSSFAAGGTGASRDIAAHLKRASLAFDDLVHFHRDLRARRRTEVGKVERKEKGYEERPEVDEEREGLGDGNLTEVERDDSDNGANGKKEKRKRRVKSTDNGQAKEEILETEDVTREHRKNKQSNRKDEAFGREVDEEEEQYNKKSKKKRKIQAN